MARDCFWLDWRCARRTLCACDRKIERRIGDFAPRGDAAVKPLPPDRKRNRRAAPARSADGQTASGFDLRTESYQVFGQIPGTDRIAFALLGEVGRDMSRWPTVAHFCSWAGLCPDNDISGGKVLWRGVRRVKHRAGQLAYALDRSPTPLGGVPPHYRYRS